MEIDLGQLKNFFSQLRLAMKSPVEWLKGLVKSSLAWNWASVDASVREKAKQHLPGQAQAAAKPSSAPFMSAYEPSAPNNSRGIVFDDEFAPKELAAIRLAEAAAPRQRFGGIAYDGENTPEELAIIKRAGRAPPKISDGAVSARAIAYDGEVEHVPTRPSPGGVRALRRDI